MDELTEYAQGWVDDPEAVAQIASDLEYQSFGDTPAGGIPEAELPKNVFLWDAAKKVLGKLLPPRNQGRVGSCVSFGTNRAIEYTMLGEIVRGDQEEYRDIAEEITYGGSRVEVGGGRLRGDGSIGAWAAKFVNQWGVVDRAVYGQFDLRQYDEKRCREYGTSGVPTELETVAKRYPIKTTTLVKTIEEAKKALAQGYGIAVCSSQGFSMSRTANGIAQPSGVWNHCMCVAGYAEISGKTYYRIDNSWGANAHTGPVGPGDPGPEGFYCDEITFAKMLKMNDTWAFSSVQGFPAKDFWFV